VYAYPFSSKERTSSSQKARSGSTNINLTCFHTYAW
jgi:hypothetical protein